MSEIFEPSTPVAAGYLTISAKHKDTGKFFAFPPVSYLEWEEDGKSFIHCLEFDLIADGQEESEATDNLVEIIFEQMKSAKEEGTQLYHPAPVEYWEKFHQILRNSLTQAFLDSRPRTFKDIKVRGQAFAHACE